MLNLDRGEFMLKEKLTYGILIFDLALFVIIPFLVFFHFIWFGLILLTGFSLISAGLYYIYKEFMVVEDKLVHHKPH